MPVGFNSLITHFTWSLESSYLCKREGEKKYPVWGLWGSAGLVAVARAAARVSAQTRVQHGMQTSGEAAKGETSDCECLMCCSYV